MSIWKRKKTKLNKTEGSENSQINDLMSMLTYNKSEEKQKEAQLNANPENKIEAIPVVIQGDNTTKTETTTPHESTTKQIIINVNIPLQKSKMAPENQADMPKTPKPPSVPKPKTSLPRPPSVKISTPNVNSVSIVAKSEGEQSKKSALQELLKKMPAEKAAAVLEHIKTGRNLTKNVDMGMKIPTPKGSNLEGMAMSEPLEKDVVDFKTKQKIGETGPGIDRTTANKLQVALNRQKMQGSPYAEQRPNAGIAPLKEDLHKEPLKKDIVDMSKWKRKDKKQKDTKDLSTEQKMKDRLFNPGKQSKQPDTRTRDQKIKDALAAQGKEDDAHFDNGVSEDDYKPNYGSNSVEPSKAELAAQQMKRNAREVNDKRRQSEADAYTREKFKDIYGDIGHELFDKLKDEPLSSHRIPGTQTKIQHYGQLSNGKHLIYRLGDYRNSRNNRFMLMDEKGNLENLGDVPMNKWSANFEPFHHTQEYHQENWPDEPFNEQEERQRHASNEEWRLNHFKSEKQRTIPSSVLAGIKKTKLYSDITGKEQKQPQGEFDKRDYKIVRGPHQWGMEVRHIPTGEEFRYDFKKIEPPESHPELQKIGKKWKIAKAKADEANIKHHEAWDRIKQFPIGSSKRETASLITDRLRDEADKLEQQARDIQGNYYTKRDELSKYVAVPSHWGRKTSYGDDHEQKDLEHKAKAARFWKEHIQNHSKLKNSPYKDIQFAENEDTIRNPFIREVAPEESSETQTLLDKWAKRNKDKLKKLPDRSPLKQRLMDVLKNSIEKHAGKMDTSEEANERRKETLKNVKNLLSERKE